MSRRKARAAQGKKGEAGTGGKSLWKKEGRKTLTALMALNCYISKPRIRICTYEMYSKQNAPGVIVRLLLNAQTSNLHQTELSLVFGQKQALKIPSDYLHIFF